MLSRRRISLLLLCPLLACCQKTDLVGEPAEAGATEVPETIVGTGMGSRSMPFTVTDVWRCDLADDVPVWVVGYVVGTAPRAMGNAVFAADADNQSNILLAADSLCSDAELCIPVELASVKNRELFSLPSNVRLFRHCLLLKAFPRKYLNRKGLRNVSEGLWLDGFDIASIAPSEWGTISL
ncbi:MAG: hypothetical protein J6W03_06135 [Bacteroidaceae bacterium]|nr:hypothetical protein [Bacteroidaceae bacterium]